MLKFEMCAQQLFLFWLLSRESGVSFTEAQPGSILTALCFKIAYSLKRKIQRELKIQMFPHQNYEPLKENSNLHSLRDLSETGPLRNYLVYQQATKENSIQKQAFQYSIFRSCLRKKFKLVYQSGKKET